MHQNLLKLRSGTSTLASLDSSGLSTDKHRNSASVNIFPMSYYSFDIFDTLVSRKYATDSGILASLREILRTEHANEFPEYLVDDFIGLRKFAQHSAHEASEYPEVTLDEIYGAFGEEFPELSSGQLRMLQSLEESLELESCYGIPRNISHVLDLLEKGNTVVLISDMYLSKALILRMLEKAEPRLASLPFYLSSELRIRKMDGDLFRRVCEDLKIKPEELTHTGDNFHSDCVMAERCGVKSVYYRDSELTVVESEYFGEERNLFQQLIVGASKQARLETEDDKPSYRLGASYTGPFFYGVVHNALKQAINEGIDRIYFLARDGYLLKVIADEIVAALGLNIKVHYLYVSRQSTYLASVFRLTPESFSWIFQEMDNVITFNKVAKRIHLEPDFILGKLDGGLKESLESHGFDTRLKPSHINGLQRALMRNSDLKSEVESKAAERRELVIGYFRQQGMLDEGRIGLADIGWRGSLQDAMFKILKSAKTDVAITSYYLAVTYFSKLTIAENRKVPAFMFPSTRAGIGPMLELLLQCDHGTTLGYRKAEVGTFEPVLKTPPGHVDAWGVSSYKEGIRKFSENLSRALKLHQKVETTYSGVTPILIEMLEDAEPEVANTLGDLHYCGDLEESHLRRFAPPFSMSEALTFLFSGNDARAGFTQWFEVSSARSGFFTRAILALDPRHNVRKLSSSIMSRRQLMEIKHDAGNFVRFHRARLLKK